MSTPPPPSAPPQWSADGQWWWDGARWLPRSEMLGDYRRPPAIWPPSPAGWTPAPPAARSPGLRIVLIVALAIDALLTGLISLAGTVAVAGGSRTATDFVLLTAFALMFALAVAAIVGVAVRAGWSRWVAIAAGIAISLTCIGLVLAIPILITAARAPDLANVST